MSPLQSYIVLFLIVLFCSIYVHEQTHAVIYESFGCTHEFGVDWSGAYTIGTCYGLTPERTAQLGGLQSGVETVGYQLLFPTLFLAMILFVLLDIRFKWSGG